MTATSMPPHSLSDRLRSLDGRGYGGYKQLKGSHRIAGFRLVIDQVQVDPYAPPSLVRAVLDTSDAGFPDELTDTEDKRVAVGDFLTRAFHSRIGPDSPVSIGHLGQQVLPRTSIAFTTEGLEARFTVALPAAGRRVRGREADTVLTRQVPGIVDTALRYRNLDQAALRRHVELYLDQVELRRQLAERHLVAFVADGAVLPRKSGDSDQPLARATTFRSPESMRTTFRLPSGRQLTGMGVGEGVTVIVGGGYHGKSTLLRAIEHGVYPHIAGDGREWVITRADAVSIRAEDGRAVTGVDISPFISGLPSGTDTTSFSTTNASGSTSQAANLVEAVATGTSLLLIDEDTSATNFMIRDERMRALIPGDREPITPFVDRVRPLYRQLGVSTLLVAGGSGAFFDVADQIIALDSYVPTEVTAQAREIAERLPVAPASVAPPHFRPAERAPSRSSLNPRSKTKPAKAKGGTTVLYGRGQTIELSALSQLVDPGQLTAVAKALDRIAELADDRSDLTSLVDRLFDRVAQHGVDALSPHRGHPGLYTLPRRQEVAAALNRYRGLGLS
ncbi:ABC-ATPase domain-containing protein [Corynebacterium halotolerans]|uniref:ABC-ATPase domain-containing protein n=1 Tax=Corynebacterium halotolerans TaxID=225326 RepID=UPI003CEAE48B